ncbi:hypothetical protein M513_09862 [Trichuris suis]|uniref:Uncharacterized protein n=1 Tax=Trichuris suis TaxID=68888 RepID=A0A085LWG4_9BILA|nr:hypothetical protein M513_09862 [Trichuris suis]
MVSGSKLDSNGTWAPGAAASITLLGFLEEATLVNPLSTEQGRKGDEGFLDISSNVGNLFDGSFLIQKCFPNW